jgi:hypothetical protein
MDLFNIAHSRQQERRLLSLKFGHGGQPPKTAWKYVGDWYAMAARASPDCSRASSSKVTAVSRNFQPERDESIFYVSKAIRHPMKNNQIVDDFFGPCPPTPDPRLTSNRAVKRATHHSGDRTQGGGAVRSRLHFSADREEQHSEVNYEL